MSDPAPAPQRGGTAVAARKDANPGEDWFGNSPLPDRFDRLEPQPTTAEPRLENPDLLLVDPERQKPATHPAGEPRLSPPAGPITARAAEQDPFPGRSAKPPFPVQTRQAPLDTLEPPPRVEPRLPGTADEPSTQSRESGVAPRAQVPRTKDNVELGIRADRPGDDHGIELDGLGLFRSEPTPLHADDEPPWKGLDGGRQEPTERPQQGRPIHGEPGGSTLGEQVGRSRTSGKAGSGSRRIWLVALLIVLVLLAGTAALVAVRLTAPDAPAGSLSVQELSDRARARLQEWGLLPP